MILLNIQGLNKAFGDFRVLKDVSFSLKQGQRIGLVGTNGCGKSTLLKLIAGDLAQDSGLISGLKDIKIGYLSQQYTPKENRSVYDELESVFDDVFLQELKLREIEKRLETEKDEVQIKQLGDDYARAMSLFENGNGYAIKSIVQGVFAGLGFKEEQKLQSASSLSGGELTRLGLARLLLSKPDVLLLDEPTNHLDLDALSWLEGFLKDYQGACIIVSHDRYFLDKLVDSVVELISGEAEVYSGNYSSYIEQRAQRYLTRMRAYEKQQKEIARQEAIIARFKAFNREKSIRAAESRQKKLDKLEVLTKPSDEDGIAMSFRAFRRMGENALSVKGLKKSFPDRELFSNISFDVKSGDRIALIGPNGVGKSTLIKCLMGESEKDDGRIIFGTNIDIGYYSQKQDTLDFSKNILDEVWWHFPRKTQTEIRKALGLFLFSGDDVYESVSVLSGGEKARVALCELMLKQDNFLLLDEPTNHLDADSRQALEDALLDFDGVIFAVSHDRYFINSFANKIFYMENNQISVFEGNYDDYIAKKQLLSEFKDERIQSGITKTELIKIKKKSREEKERLKQAMDSVKRAEKRVSELEKIVDELERELARPENYQDEERAKELNKNYQDALYELDEAYSDWEELQEALEAVERQQG